MIRNFTLSLLVVLGCCSMKGQDLHFSYYQMVPLYVNPALTGAFNGSFRVGGLLRDQDFTSTTNEYLTVEGYIDAPIIRGLRKQDWIGVGFVFDILDNAGATKQKNQLTRLSLAYHLALDKKQTSILSFGGQYILGSRKYDGNVILTNEPEDLLTRPTYLGLPDLDIDGIRNSIMDMEYGDDFKMFNFGVMYSSKGATSDMKIGVAASNIPKPTLSISGTESRDVRISAFGKYTTEITKKTSLTPGFFYQKQGSASEALVNGILDYKLKPEKQISINGGLGVRNFRQVIFLAGMDYKSFKFGISYDLDISAKTAASGSVGGFEIGVGYLGKIYKKPKPKPVILCPRL